MWAFCVQFEGGDDCDMTAIIFRHHFDEMKTILDVAIVFEAKFVFVDSKFGKISYV